MWMGQGLVESISTSGVVESFNSQGHYVEPIRELQAAGVPLDPTFVEQKRILARCSGRFYPCANGAEARRFNRLLIDAGLIKQL